MFHGSCEEDEIEHFAFDLMGVLRLFVREQARPNQLPLLGGELQHHKVLRIVRG